MHYAMGMKDTKNRHKIVYQLSFKIAFETIRMPPKHIQNIKCKNPKHIQNIKCKKLIKDI